MMFRRKGILFLNWRFFKNNTSNLSEIFFFFFINSRSEYKVFKITNVSRLYYLGTVSETPLCVYLFMYVFIFYSYVSIDKKAIIVHVSARPTNKFSRLLHCEFKCKKPLLKIIIVLIIFFSHSIPQVLYHPEYLYRSPCQDIRPTYPRSTGPAYSDISLLNNIDNNEHKEISLQ
jgi:hypothetical protein